jgi:hypothetical protein
MFASRTLVALAGMAALLPSCIASSPAPQAWQRSLDDVQRVTYGAWTRVEGPGLAIDGELIAVEPTRILLGRGAQVAAVPSRCVDKLAMAAFEAPAGTIAWGVVGSLSTPSHGYFMVFSLPIWLLTATMSTYAQTSTGHLVEPRLGGAPLPVDRIRKWARFPQGLPAGYLDQVAEVREFAMDCRTITLRPRPVAPPPLPFAPSSTAASVPPVMHAGAAQPGAAP